MFSWDDPTGITLAVSIGISFNVESRLLVTVHVACSTCSRRRSSEPNGTYYFNLPLLTSLSLPTSEMPLKYASHFKSRTKTHPHFHTHTHTEYINA